MCMTYEIRMAWWHFSTTQAPHIYFACAVPKTIRSTRFFQDESKKEAVCILQSGANTATSRTTCNGNTVCSQIWAAHKKRTNTFSFLHLRFCFRGLRILLRFLTSFLSAVVLGEFLFVQQVRMNTTRAADEQNHCRRYGTHSYHDRCPIDGQRMSLLCWLRCRRHRSWDHTSVVNINWYYRILSNVKRYWQTACVESLGHLLNSLGTKSNLPVSQTPNKYSSLGNFSKFQTGATRMPNLWSA